MAVRGLTRFARPCGAARLLRARSVQLAAPVVEPRSGVLIPPVENIKEKSPYFRTGSHLEYGGEGGLTRFARPCGAARLLRARSVQLAAPVVEPRSGVLIPPVENIKEKSPYFRTGSHLEYGGEGGFEPRYVAVYTLSRRAPSATRTPHHIVFPVVVGNGR